MLWRRCFSSRLEAYRKSLLVSANTKENRMLFKYALKILKNINAGKIQRCSDVSWRTRIKICDCGTISLAGSHISALNSQKFRVSCRGGDTGFIVDKSSVHFRIQIPIDNYMPVFIRVFLIDNSHSLFAFRCDPKIHLPIDDDSIVEIWLPVRSRQILNSRQWGVHLTRKVVSDF